MSDSIDVSVKHIKQLNALWVDYNGLKKKVEEGKTLAEYNRLKYQNAIDSLKEHNKELYILNNTLRDQCDEYVELQKVNNEILTATKIKHRKDLVKYSTVGVIFGTIIGLLIN